MLRIYSDSPENIELDIKELRDALSHKNVARGKKGQQELKVGDVFFITLKNSIGIVERKSAKGAHLRFKQFFYKKSELGEHNQAIVKRIDDYLKASQTFQFEDESLLSFAKDLKASITRIAQTNIPAQGIAQEALPYAFNAGPDPVEEPDKISAVKNVFKEQITAKKEPIIAALIKAGIKDTISDEHLNKILPFLIPYAELHPEFLRQDQSNESFLSQLEDALFEVIGISSEEECGIFEKVIEVVRERRNLPPPQVPPPGGVDIKNLSLVQGDSFITGTGYAGDINSKTYSNLVVKYLKNRGNLSSEAQNLIYTLDNPVDLTETERGILPNATDTREKIKEIIKNCPIGPNGEKKCLLFGGWYRHAVVYEIEKKANGKYAFRVYNQGEGAEAHDKVEVGYRTKYSCFYAVDDIDEKEIFKASFLASLIQITKMVGEKNGQNILYDGILFPLFGDKREDVSKSSLNKFIHIQRAGTCVYRSLQSFMARSLTENDYKRFKFEFSLFILQNFFPEAQKIANKKPTNVTDYSELVKEYNLLKKSVERFSGQVKEKSHRLSQGEIQKARRQISEYHLLLNKIQKNLFAYESHQLEFSAQTVEIQRSEGRIADPLDFESNSLKIKPATLSEPAQALLKAIDQIREIPNVGFESQVIINVIDHFGRELDQMNKIEQQFLLDKFLKTIGPIKNYQKIRFDSEENMKIALSKADQLLYKIYDCKLSMSWKATFSLALYHLSECAFNQLSPTEKSLGQEYASFLSFDQIDHLKHFVYLDPFWSDFIHDLNAHLTQKNGIKYSLPNYVTNKYDMDPAMVKKILECWEEKAKGFNIEESIEQDRKAQKDLIQLKEEIFIDQIAEEKAKHVEKKSKLEELIKDLNIKEIKAGEIKNKKLNETDQLQLNTLIKGVKKIKDTIKEVREEIEVLEKEIHQLELRLSNVTINVEHLPEFWPKGWEHGMGEKEKAMFIFGNPEFFLKKLKINDVLSDSFRTFFLTSMRIENMFIKTESLKGQDRDYRIHYKKEIRSFPELSLKQTVTSSNTSWDLSNIGPSMEATWHKPFLKIYDSRESTENDAPMISDGIKNNPMTSEEMREMIACQPKEIRFESLLSFFEENQDKLADQNWIMLFYSNFFESHFLLDELTDPKKVQQLDDFFERIITNARAISNFKVLGNIMMIKGSYKRYLFHLAKSDAEKRRHLNLNEVRSLIEQGLNSLSKDNLSILFEGLAAYCAQIALTPDFEEDTDVAVLINILRIQFPVIKFSLPMRSSLASDLENKIAVYFTNPLAKNAAALKNPNLEKLLKKAFPRMGELKQKEDQNDALESINGDTIISLSTGKIATEDSHLLSKFSARPPRKLIEKLVKLGLVRYETESLRAEIKGEGTYIWNPHRNQILLAREGSAEDIYCEITTQKGEKEWLKFIPPDNRDKFKMNLKLKDRFHHFFSEKDNSLYLCDKETMEVRYFLDKNFKDIREVGSNFKLAKSTMFQSFEDPNWSSFWISDDGKLKKIEFPRMNLTFEFNAENQEFQCKEKPGWFLSKDQFAPHLGPFTGFLRLENKKSGKAKILLPLFNSKYEDDPSPLNYPFKYSFEVYSRENIRYAEYKLKNNRLIPNSLEGRYQLARIYLEKGFLDLAEALLFKQTEIATRPLSREERLILNQMVFEPKSGEISSQNIRCRLHALYLLERDAQTQREEALVYNKGTLDKKVELYENYLDRLTHIKPLALREEILLLEKYAFYSEKIKMRYSELQNQGREGFGSVEQAIQNNSNENRRFFIERVGDLHRLFIPPAQPEETFFKRCRYFHSRNKNSFPFDYTKRDQLQKGFEDFYPYLLKEAEKLKNLPKSRKNGFLSFCTYLSFSDIANASEVSILLGIVEKTFKETHSILDKSPKVRILPWSGTPPASKIKREVQKLNILKILKSAEDKDSYLSSQSTGIFGPSPVGEEVPEEEEALAPENLDQVQEILAPIQNIEAQQVEEVPVQEPPQVQEKEALPEQNEKLSETLIFSQKAPEVGSNKVVESQFIVMREDIDLAKANLKKERVYSEVTDVALSTLRGELEGKYKEENQTLMDLEKLLLTSVHAALTASDVSALEFHSGIRSLPTIEDLVILCSKMDDGQAIKILYPELSLSDVELTKLRSAIKEYLLQKSYVQQLSRSIKGVDDLEGVLEPENRKILLNELGKTLNAKWSYKKGGEEEDLSLILLTVETCSDMRLREDQIERIRNFYLAWKDERMLVEQMIMGAGKTTVIQPLLAILFAKPDLLSTITTPESLFKKTRSYLSKILGTSYQRLVFSDPFTRDLAKNTAFLKIYLSRLEDAKKIGGVTVFTPQYKYAIYSSLKEAFFDDNQERGGNFNEDLSFIGHFRNDTSR